MLACCAGWSGPRCTEGRSWQRRSGTVVPCTLGLAGGRGALQCHGDEPCPPAAGEGSLGHCYAGWQCQDAPGARNLSAVSMAECCRQPWGHSWRNASSVLCFACTHQPLAGGSGGSQLQGDRRGALPGTC